MLFVISNPDIMSGDAEGVPRDVEPSVACEELVGQIVRLEEIDEALELLRVLGADVGGLAKQVLRVTDTPHEGVDARDVRGLSLAILNRSNPSIAHRLYAETARKLIHLRSAIVLKE
jgi:hypothetical protein